MDGHHKSYLSCRKITRRRRFTMLGPRLFTPAVFDFNGLPWKWVSIHDLMILTGCTVTELWSRYFALSKDAPREVMTLATQFGKTIQVGLYEFPNSLETFYAPAGWGLEVARVFHLGVHTVELVHHYHSDSACGMACPEGSIGYCRSNGQVHGGVTAVGYKKDGKPFWTYAECTHEEKYHEYNAQDECDVCSRCGEILKQYIND